MWDDLRCLTAFVNTKSRCLLPVSGPMSFSLVRNYPILDLRSQKVCDGILSRGNSYPLLENHSICVGQVHNSGDMCWTGIATVQYPPGVLKSLNDDTAVSWCDVTSGMWSRACRLSWAVWIRLNNQTNSVIIKTVSEQLYFPLLCCRLSVIREQLISNQSIERKFWWFHLLSSHDW